MNYPQLSIKNLEMLLANAALPAATRVKMEADLAARKT
jgi:hypothetical protein